MSETRIRTTDRAEALFGAAVVVGCAVVVWTASGYGIGTPRRMGPGFFPFMLGVGGIVLGLAMVLRGFRPSLPQGQEVPLRRLGFIGAAFVFFALGIEPLGLIVTLFGTTLLGAMADKDARPGQTVVLAACLTGAIWLVFVYLLGLSIPVWPTVH